MLSGLGPIVGSLPVAVAVFLVVCKRTMRDAAASSDESHPASRSIGGKPRSLEALSRDTRPLEEQVYGDRTARLHKIGLGPNKEPLAQNIYECMLAYKGG